MTDIKQTATINPYRHAMVEVVKRLIWDIKPESWRSRRILRNFKNKYVGEKAVVVCNGPSLLKSDLSLLQDVFTFGLNKINLLFDKSDYRPSCIVAVNPFVIEQNKQFYNETEIQLFLDSIATTNIKSRRNVSFLHSGNQIKFAQDCSISIHQGATVTFVALQLAFHMGFKKVALIGCDHNFATEGPAGKTVISGDKDPNHFDPNYFSGGVKWQLPNLFHSEVSYNMANQIFEQNGRTIVNATEGGLLEVYPRISLFEYIHNF